MSESRSGAVSAAALVRYRDRRLTDITTLRSALEQKDFASIREVGHRIKGNAALYGLGSLGEAAVALEKAALESNISAASEGLTRFEACVSEIQTAIEAASAAQV